MQTREIGITVEKIMQLPIWESTRLVAGKRGHNRIVKFVNIMEVPDILDWVKDGEFLLTTAFAIKDDPEAKSHLIPRLAEKGLAGLAIKPGRYIDQIPPMMIEQANALNFPLIELPFQVSFSDLMNQIFGEIFHLHAHFMDKSLATHELLMEVVLQGGGLDEIAEALSSLVKNPVAIVNVFGEMLVSAHWSYDYEREWIFERTKIGRFETQEVLFSEHLLKLISFPISASQKVYGFILVLETGLPLEQIDLISIERASTIAALEMINRQAINEVERRYMNELLYDLLHRRFESEEIIAARAKNLHLNLNLLYSVVVVHCLNEDGKELAVRTIRQVSVEDKVVIGDWGSQLIVLWPVTGPVSTLSQEVGFSRKLDWIQKNLDEGNVKYLMGIGTAYSGPAHLAMSYQEASRALKVAQAMESMNRALFYESLGIYRLFEHISRNELEKFMQEMLKPLINYDAHHQTGLIDTLEMYFKSNGNLKKVAESLYLHYNTVLYRMERIQEITKIDLRERDGRLSLEVALKIYWDFRGKKGYPLQD